MTVATPSINTRPAEYASLRLEGGQRIPDPFASQEIWWSVPTTIMMQYTKPWASNDGHTLQSPIQIPRATKTHRTAVIRIDYPTPSTVLVACPIWHKLTLTSVIKSSRLSKWHRKGFAVSSTSRSCPISKGSLSHALDVVPKRANFFLKRLNESPYVWSR